MPLQEINIGMIILLIFFCGLFDRARGDSRNIINTFAEKVMYGCCVGFLCIGVDWLVIPFSLLFALGSSPGWGDPMGAYLGRKTYCGGTESWQFDGWIRHTVKSLWIRGFIWGLPLILMTPWVNTWPAFIACTVAFHPALKLARDWKFAQAFIHRDLVQGQWGLTEIFRGILIGALTYGVAIL